MNPDWTFRWKDAPHAFDPDLLETLETSFLVEFLESALPAHGQNVEVLSELGELYTRTGRHEDGLAVDLRLVKLIPDNPTAHYNLACSLALTGQTQKALRSLDAALRCGFTDFRLMLEDDDLDSLRNEPEFQAMVDLGRKAIS